MIAIVHITHNIRSQDGSTQTGVSQRVYGSSYWDNREIYCKQTIASSLYASETSFVVRRMKILIGGRLTSIVCSYCSNNVHSNLRILSILNLELTRIFRR